MWSVIPAAIASHAERQMTPTEIVEGEPDGYCCPVVLPFLREGIRKSGESADAHTQAEIGPLNYRSGDALRIGLSVYDSYRIDRRACIESELSCHGIVTLHAGTLRNLGLAVIRDPTDYQKLLIVDMPLENPGDAEQEALLDAVSDSACITEKCRWRKPQ